MTWLDRIHVGDCLQVLATLPDTSVDAVVTDPPYGLSFMGKRWDYDVPAVEVWAECLRVLKPGGHLLAFAGTRTQHRMAVRIEDAGFEIRDMIAWVYGSGFPKSHNLDGAWVGWGTALKPALEPITVARKPLAGTVAENVLAHGVGALNIDRCRVPGETPVFVSKGEPSANCYADGLHGSSRTGEVSTAGRWPANLIHDGSEEVLAAFPDAPGQLAPQSSSSSRKFQNVYGAMKRGGRPGGFGNVGAEKGDPVPNGPLYSDTGSAARFFYCAKASREDRDDGLHGLEAGKVHAASGDGRCWDIPGSLSAPRRNAHPTVKPTDLMRYLCRLVTPPGGVVLDPFAGSGSTLRAAVLEGFRYVGIELDPAYADIARRRVAACALRETAPLF